MSEKLKRYRLIANNYCERAKKYMNDKYKDDIVNWSRIKCLSVSYAIDEEETEYYIFYMDGIHPKSTILLEDLKIALKTIIGENIEISAEI